MFPPNDIFPVMSTLPLTPKLPVMFVLASSSIEPVPVVLTSKLLFVAVVSIRLPTICMSSVRNGPPTISPITVNVPLIVALLLTDNPTVDMLLTPVILPPVIVISPPVPLTTTLVPTVNVPLENVSAPLS